RSPWKRSRRQPSTGFSGRLRPGRCQLSSSPAQSLSGSSHGQSCDAAKASCSVKPAEPAVSQELTVQRREKRADVPFCPSAQPEMEGAVVFGVIEGTPEEPRVAYLTEPLPVTPELLALAEPVEPTEVFRIGAQCAEHACQHFASGKCQLGRKLAEEVP